MDSSQTSQLVIFTTNAPKELLEQADLILRAEWPASPEDKNVDRDWDITHHVFLTDNTGVISYAAIARKMLTHVNQIYDVIGMSGVITRKDKRGQGHGRRVISAATKIITESSADLALFNTAQIGLYEKFGYEKLPMAKMLKGDANNPKVYPEDVIALFLSPHAKKHRNDFELIPIYFGQKIW